MFATGIARGATALLFIAGLSACASAPPQPSYPVPDQPGIYSFTSKNDLRRLDGDPNWEASTWPDRANVPPNAQFVVNDPALANRAPNSSIELWRVAWVRSEVNGANQSMPVTGAEWDVAPISPYAVPFSYDSPRNKPNVVRITPTAPLAPGLYAIRINNPGARQARLGVGWNSLDQRQYSAANCVDRYVAEGNIYRPCNAAYIAQPLTAAPVGTVGVYSPGVSAPAGTMVAVPATTVAVPSASIAAPTITYPGLDISMAEPMRRNNGLLIQGTVTNTTNQVQLVPALQATLQDSSGRDVQRWVFQSSASSLAPGGRASFQTEVRPVLPEVSSVSVNFAQR